MLYLINNLLEEKMNTVKFEKKNTNIFAFAYYIYAKANYRQTCSNNTVFNKLNL